jgi:nitrate reductase NapE component
MPKTGSSRLHCAVQWRELRAFLFLTIVLAPLLSAVIVGGYGFLV